MIHSQHPIIHHTENANDCPTSYSIIAKFISKSSSVSRAPAQSTRHSANAGPDASALVLLNNILTSGTSSGQRPAFVPHYSHISLAGTLLVHPVTTTRAPNHERAEVSTQSFVYLRNLFALVGPARAKFGDAFTFIAPDHGRGRRKLRRSHAVDGAQRHGSESPGAAEGEIVSPMAAEDSVWRRAQDFWHVVGWAFNCSVGQRKRWRFWKVWLAYMLDVIEADWKERTSGRAAGDDDSLEDSLLIRYIGNSGGTSSVTRRMVKAVFANGEPESMRLFPEVFANETLERKKADTVRKRKRGEGVNVELDNYGDYVGTEEDLVEEDTTFWSSQPTTSSDGDNDSGTDAAQLIEDFGGPEAVTMRKRLIALVSCSHMIIITSLTVCRSCLRPRPPPRSSV